MRINALFLIFCITLVSCSSEKASKDIQNIIKFELNQNLNKLNKKHIKCYKCEIGDYPEFVSEIVTLEPKSSECINLFSSDLDFASPDVEGFQITRKEWNDRITFVLSESGIAFNDIREVKNERFLTINISYSELKCEE